MPILPRLPGVPVLAFDPGHHTGIVEVNNGRVVRSYTYDYEEMMRTMLLDGHPWAKYPVWVVERFVLYPWKSDKMAFDDMVSSRLIGALDLTARRVGTQTVLQAASAAKGLIKDSRLASYGWKVNTRHEQDAARHAMYYLLEQRRRNAKQVQP